MAATSRTLSYDAVLTTTADKIHKSGAIQDAITNSNPTFSEFMSKGRIKKVEVGGDQIRVPLMYQHNGTIKSYSEYETINVDPQDGITTMYMPWAQYGGAVSISGIQRFKNMGKEKIADLLKAKITQTTAGWSEKLTADLWDAAGLQTTTHPYSGNSGKNIAPIPVWIQCFSGATSDDFNIGHIDQSAETWWKNKEVDFVAATATGTNLKYKMLQIHNDCSQGPGGHPDLYMLDQNVYQNYVMSLEDQVRYQFTDKASMGFESVAFLGAKVMWDGYVPDAELGANGVLSTGSAMTNNSVYAINTKTMCLYVGKDHDWKPRGFQTPVDQDASTSLYLAYLQLVCDNRRKNGVIYDVTPTFTAF
jgi:hypothetical protein